MDTGTKNNELKIFKCSSGDYANLQNVDLEYFELHMIEAESEDFRNIHRATSFAKERITNKARQLDAEAITDYSASVSGYSYQYWGDDPVEKRFAIYATATALVPKKKKKK